MRFGKALFLLVVILLSGAFIYARFGAAGPETNYFNTHYRLRLASTPLLRTILGLHFDGDGRTDYLGPRFEKIVIEVDAVDGVKVDTALLDRFAMAVEEITGKPTSYILSDTHLVYSNLNNEDTDTFALRYRTFRGSDAARIYLMIFDTKRGDSKILGLTYKEYGIMLFNQNLEAFTKQAPISYNNYAYSTLLHEFGHQIGLGHNDEPHCIMNPKAEVSDLARFDPYDVVTSFCSLEEEQIGQQRDLARFN